ncbi:hypothetical protein HK099_005502 [Clydaea vesicula]|uniref:Guanylate cyclase domain-containing protein n=1 Tax=Clydaea vesicula TaxID=447962 RepID=A0AAD5UA78_9FUNG|nr:hypothetical protein HK099_005502 [Clydaea vesicula]
MRRNSNTPRRHSGGEKDNLLSMTSFQLSTAGLKFESIVPCFISKHVKNYCDSTCWRNWIDATSEISNLTEEEKDNTSIEELFISKMKKSINDMRPDAEETFAAVVMADVSGYSNLSATLAEKGAEGAEILSKTMKGDAVIFYWKLEKFDPGGESPTSTNQSEEITRGEIVLKAAHCCLELLKLLGSYEVHIPDQGQKILRIHLGIGAGTVFDVAVGGVDRWEHFIGGDAVNQLASVLDLAKAGELALSHQALKCFSTIVDIASVGIGSYDKRCIILTGLESAKRKMRHLPTNKMSMTEDSVITNDSAPVLKKIRSTVGQNVGNGIVETVEFDESMASLDAVHILPDLVQTATVDMYKLFINPSALYKLQTDINQSRLFRVDAGLTDLMSLRESRQVTTIFIRIGALTKWDSEATLNSAQEAMTLVQGALRKYEGSLRQKHVDDKGATILIFFGLPPLAHENDASLGLKAGLEICEKFNDLFDDFSIGITTGMVSIGGVGNENRIEYAVMGDSINMAARLMCSQKCKGLILCDEKTYALCESEFSFETLGQIKVKGKSHQISIFQPKKLKSNELKKQIQPENDIFIGRERERLIIENILKAHVTTSGPRILVVEGDGGMGVSTLTRWTDSQAEKMGCYVATGNSAQIEKTTRYYIWREIITEFLSIVESLADNPNRTTNLSETRIPTFLMTHKEDKSSKVSSSTEEGSSGRKSGVNSMVGVGGASKKSGMKNTRRVEKSAISSVGIQSSNSTAFAASSKRGKIPNARGKPMNNDDFRPQLTSSTSTEALATHSIVPNNLPANAMRKWAAFEENLRKGLIKMGEAPSQTALMNLVFPYEFHQTDVYVKLQGKFRINELTDLVRRIINVITEQKPMVIILNESQWIDQLSWELIWELALSCPKLMICCFSRPEKHFENEETKQLYNKFKKYPKTEIVLLEGLSIEDTNKLIIHNWPVPVTSVQSTISENVQKRTGGNPLYIKSMVVALKESGHIITEGGMLKLAKKDFDFEKSISLESNLNSVLTAQLDRLDASFQLFLKVASILGQPFVLEDVLCLLQDTPGFGEVFESGTVENTIAKIKSMDRYDFLLRLENVATEQQLQFKSSVVRNCIYSMMLTTQRQQLHLNIAMYYEKIIDVHNQQRILVSLYEHYSETDEKYTMKKLTYLEIVAHVCFEKNSIGEAIKNYCLLIEGVEKAAKNPTVTFDNTSKSTWHRELGEAYYYRGDEVKAEKHLLESLKLAGKAYPNNPLWLSWKLRIETNLRTKFPILLAGDADLTSAVSVSPELKDATGSNDSLTGNITDESGEAAESKPFDVSEAAKKMITDKMRFDPMAVQLAEMLQSKELSLLHNVRRSMASLAVIYLNTGRLKDHIYCAYVGTNISELFPRDALYAVFMSMCGNIAWISTGKKRITLRYLESASKHDQRYDLSQTVAIVLKSALTFFFMGKWGSSIRRLGLLPAIEMMSGDFLIRLDALRMRSIIIHMCGARPQSLKAARALFAIATQEDSWEGQLWGCQMMIANFLNTVKNAVDLPESGKMLQSIWMKIPEKLKGDPILLLNYTALISKLEFKINPKNFPVDEFLRNMAKISADLNKSPPKKFSENTFNARGGESNSAGGPHEWLAMVGIVHCASVVFGLFDSGSIQKPSQKRHFVGMCRDIVSWLNRGNIMNRMTIAQPIKFLFKGIGILISSRNAAVRIWRKGLSCRRVSDLMYVRGLLHLQIACYSENPSDSNHNAHEAQKLFSRIGATIEFERAKSLRKDRKGKSKNSKSGSGTGSEVKELDDNCGDSIFDEMKSYGDRSTGEQSSVDNE